MNWFECYRWAEGVRCAKRWRTKELGTVGETLPRNHYPGPPNWESANTKIKREETGERKGGSPFLFPATAPLFPDHALIFSRACHLRVMPTIWEPVTGYSPSPSYDMPKRKFFFGGAGGGWAHPDTLIPSPSPFSLTKCRVSFNSCYENTSAVTWIDSSTFRLLRKGRKIFNQSKNQVWQWKTKVISKLPLKIK